MGKKKIFARGLKSASISGEIGFRVSTAQKWLENSFLISLLLKSASKAWPLQVFFFFFLTYFLLPISIPLLGPLHSPPFPSSFRLLSFFFYIFSMSFISVSASTKCAMLGVYVCVCGGVHGLGEITGGVHREKLLHVFPTQSSGSTTGSYSQSRKNIHIYMPLKP